MRALLLIDLQNDFCPFGALAVPQGEEVIPVANRLMDRFDLVVATQDWHPADHGSFAANHPWRNPGGVIQLDGLEQILWPIHCVQNSFGAEMVASLQQSKINRIFTKGTDPLIDSYSGFFDNGHRKSTGLGDFLREQGVDTLYIMGLALDYCVKYSVLDALELGFKTYLVVDGSRAVNLQANDGDRALQLMQEKGAIVIHSDDIP